MAIPDRLYRLYLRDYSREAKACFMWESEENPLEMSPGGLGVGIGQQSAAFQQTYPPLLAALSDGTHTTLQMVKSWVGAKTGLWIYDHAMATDRRWHPAFQLACYATFVYRHRDLYPSARWRRYHYGHDRDDDPDGYVEHVMTEWNKLTGWGAG